MPWIICGILIVCIIILCIALKRKQILDKTELNKYNKEVTLLEHRKKSLNEDIEFCEKQIAREQRHFEEAQVEHNKAIARQTSELDAMYERNKVRRMEQLENEMRVQEEKSRQLLQQKIEEYNVEVEKEKKHAEQVKEEINQNLLDALQEASFQHVKFESLLAPLQQYEKAQQERLYYTIQVPEEYHNDIDYLLNVVSQKVNHPDIISKLVWAEYIKPYMDETIKRIGIKDESGIYKITNIETGKCYIGKSTNVKKRLQDHFKSSVGIASIADQAIHHAILEQGIWNWMIEIITYCDKDKLNELEKYYIEFFKSQEYGFNKTGGG